MQQPTIKTPVPNCVNIARFAETTAIRMAKSFRPCSQKANNKKALRDVAREDFLDVYAEVAARVKAEFPRDRRMQDLFFDTVTEESVGEEGSDEEDTAEGRTGAPEGASKPS